ncbi:MAG: hypothetical protein CL912_14070 [Deltaproteobacteria bacterium]|nr:hypothetical protein [Deltaproteobacteria bacterium]
MRRRQINQRPARDKLGHADIGAKDGVPEGSLKSASKAASKCPNCAADSTWTCLRTLVDHRTS